MFTAPIQELIDEFTKLPGIGAKSAQRMVFYLLKNPSTEARRLAEAIVQMKEKIGFCRICFNLADQELCDYCRDPRRDASVICVVQEPFDIAAIERTREYRGLYHVLGGALNPLEGVGPDDLRIAELLNRLRPGSAPQELLTPAAPPPPAVTEVIVATNPNTEGQQTALHLARLIGPTGIRITRLASGLPVGGDLEYADEVTLGLALQGRRQIS
ncbi:MAG: recombination protein RecR [Actinomycetota bacterium]|nr:recombination protein RecR [Actinomycetota bacterium]